MFTGMGGDQIQIHCKYNETKAYLKYIGRKDRCLYLIAMNFPKLSTM